MDSNFEIAVKAEMKKVVRCFRNYSTDEISLLHWRGGRPSRNALNRGEFFYTHPSAPGIAFKERSMAASYVLTRGEG